MTIIHGLAQEFEVYFVNGGNVIQDFYLPQGVQVVNLPAAKSGQQTPGKLSWVEDSLDICLAVRRRQQLLELCDRIRPSAVLLELFPFNHQRFTNELIPLLERARQYGAKTICSWRDVIGPAINPLHHHPQLWQLLNQYFDQLLIHSDPNLISLDYSLVPIRNLTCQINYTGFVVPNIDRGFAPKVSTAPPTILVSIGDGRSDHTLLNCIAEVSQYLEDKIPHHIHMVTGIFTPMDVYEHLQTLAADQPNLTVQRYHCDLLSVMAQADLFIGMANDNTLLDVLQTRVPAMLLPLPADKNQTQRLCPQRLAELEIIKIVEHDLEPILFSFEILEALSRYPHQHVFCLRGVQVTATRIKQLVTRERDTTPVDHSLNSSL
ncbi:glycosyltransferase family protein [Leptolyngbya sp. Heron Island J]|uniref:glycosyltransferase family protein n=1 Tax=Leptolyngbya sp. Heron Island J TaxID=1385935 RepID=UPI001F33F906|nr:glycosyltransferase [Leptolyngbya sp. Heron Island J]